ncbi:Hypothetical protein A7982_07414 [Minicystis rosea]|nr:Hypothetical protein A7982_07414 [Minicystis rosea]
MRTRDRFALLFSLFVSIPFVAACGSDVHGTGTGGGGTAPTSTTSTGGSGGTGGVPDAGPIDKAKDCAATFGQALTSAFGRADGTVLAILKPSDTQCPLPNDDHVILQITMNGEAYRMVINVQSDFGDPQVQYLAIDHALPGPAWSEGWHTGLALDYVTDFGVHANGFTSYPLAELSDVIADAIALGQKVSVYAESSGGSSAHKVHRNGNNTDGAIVLGADGPAPKVMLFHFANQTF